MSTVSVVDEICQLFAEKGSAFYGESVTQTQHALQSAYFAEQEGAPSTLITAALLHDIGHLIADEGEDYSERGVDDRHEQVGQRWLAQHFGDAVTRPVQLHVAAKRYLCAAEPGYYERLSPASVASLNNQGGPFSAQEVEAFRTGTFWEEAVRLRRWDELAKQPELETPGLDHYRPHVEAALREAPAEIA